MGILLTNIDMHQSQASSGHGSRLSLGVATEPPLNNQEDMHW